MIAYPRFYPMNTLIKNLNIKKAITKCMPAAYMRFALCTLYPNEPTSYLPIALQLVFVLSSSMFNYAKPHTNTIPPYVIVICYMYASYINIHKL